MVYSIYTITNKVNSHQYVGYTSSPHNRWSRHIREAKLYAPKSQCRKLYAAMNKYGVENFDFTVIYQSYDKQHTKQHMEHYFICELSTHMSCGGYNMTWGGDGGPGVTSEQATANNNRRIANGTHIFLTDDFRGKLSEHAIRRNAAHISDGTHIMLSDAFRQKATQAARETAGRGGLFRQSPEGKARSRAEMQAKMNRANVKEARRLCELHGIKIKSLHIRKDEFLDELIRNITEGTYRA